MTEKNAYILGTDQEELYRLGLQHQVWAKEAQTGWALAAFTAGQTLLDLGCGPGFCSKELAFITGPKGKVIAVDKSQQYIDHLDRVAATHQLNIETRSEDFNDLKLENNSLDGMYSRWALAWPGDPLPIIRKVYDALKPGGKMVLHEYYNWSTHQTEPEMPHLKKAIAAALQSFHDAEGDINIGRKLPALLAGLGMKIDNVRLMAKVGRPFESTWQWPKTFFEVYFPKLVDLQYLSREELQLALKDLQEIEQNPNATLCCPLMVEVIASK